MCWKGRKNDMRCSDKDTKVLKVLYKKIPYDKSEAPKYYAPLVACEYELNKEYEVAPIKLLSQSPLDFRGYLYKVDEGLHSFSTKLKVEKLPVGDTKITIYKIGDYKFPAHKYHLFSMGNLYLDQSGEFECVVVEAIIPAGTTYYENPEGEIVSNKLILTDKIVEVDG